MLSTLDHDLRSLVADFGTSKTCKWSGEHKKEAQAMQPYQTMLLTCGGGEAGSVRVTDAANCDGEVLVDLVRDASTVEDLRTVCAGGGTKATSGSLTNAEKCTGGG
ncbi:alcohol dehydrogenase [Striga asiatica]|uniref:Alcohol dehydrogenase n=1 Tax=Striga asiatica TaxID=4170 RepID=A0A5A7QL79_STRAF|nr:alcohol dehydrogenase [Striga asiatica]